MRIQLLQYLEPQLEMMNMAFVRRGSGSVSPRGLELRAASNPGMKVDATLRYALCFLHCLSCMILQLPGYLK